MPAGQSPPNTNQPAGAPVAPVVPSVVIETETLSHQWQSNSPAIDTNVRSGQPLTNALNYPIAS